MDKPLRNSLIAVCVAAVVLLGAAATILIQVSVQLHKSPYLMLKVEATVDYVGRAAKNFDDATKVWKEASQTEADYLHNTLPAITKQVQTNLTNSNSLLVSLKNTSEIVSQSATTLTTQAATTLASTSTLFNTANETVAGFQPVERAATDSLFHLKTTLDLFGTTISDPNIKTTLSNVVGMTTTGNHMLFTADAVETKATHSYLHPSTNPLHRAWDYVSPFLVPAATVASRIVP